MNKKYNILTMVLVCCLLIVSICACSNTNTRIESETGNTEDNNTTFIYPSKTDFKFSVKIQKASIGVGESFVIECSLLNDTEREYFIEHGIETITYSYNNDAETLDSLSVLDTFKSGTEIKRDLNIEGKKSGKIIVTASIRVKPAQYSDSYETYTYTEQLDVIVQ